MSGGILVASLVFPDPPVAVAPTGPPAPGVAGGALLSVTGITGEPPGTIALTSGVQLPAGIIVTDLVAQVNSGSGDFDGPGLYARVWTVAADAPDLSTALDAYGAAVISNWDQANANLFGISMHDPSGVLVFAEAYNDTDGVKNISDGFIQVYWQRRPARWWAGVAGSG